MSGLQENHDFLYKLCLCGDGGVGKTSILNCYTGQKFQINYKVTIGCHIVTHHQMIDDQLIKFQLWDLAGQQRFEIVRSTFYRGSHAAILVFDRTKLLSLHNLFLWVKEILANVGHEIPFIILGNKSDLKDKILINDNELKEFIRELKTKILISKLPYFSTSAKSGLNIEEIFIKIGRILRKSNPQTAFQKIIKKKEITNIS